MVKRLEKQVILVANKGEDIAHRNEAWEFLSLGLGAPRSISALTGYACLSLLDEVVGLFPKGGLKVIIFYLSTSIYLYSKNFNI